MFHSRGKQLPIYNLFICEYPVPDFLFFSFFLFQKHNHYVAAREYYADTFEAIEFHEFVTKRLQALKKEEEKSATPFTWR